MHSRQLAIVGSVAIGVITVLLLSSSLGSLRKSTAADLPPSLQAAGKPVNTSSDATPIHYVAITGTNSGDCSKPVSACFTIQYAVDQAGEGDEIRIASGVYTGVTVRPRNNVTTTGVVTQMVYVSKTIIIRGGYTVTNGFADPPTPEANHTTLDAQGRGRVFYITGDISPTIEGLRIIGGSAYGLGGTPGGIDAGGGLCIMSATATLSNNYVCTNTSPVGFAGALYLFESDSTLHGNAFVSNTATLMSRKLYAESRVGVSP
jgi:hypothetical protein